MSGGTGKCEATSRMSHVACHVHPPPPPPVPWGVPSKTLCGPSRLEILALKPSTLKTLVPTPPCPTHLLVLPLQPRPHRGAHTGQHKRGARPHLVQPRPRRPQPRHLLPQARAAVADCAAHGACPGQVGPGPAREVVVDTAAGEGDTKEAAGRAWVRIQVWGSRIGALWQGGWCATI